MAQNTEERILNDDGNVRFSVLEDAGSVPAFSALDDEPRATGNERDFEITEQQEGRDFFNRTSGGNLTNYFGGEIGFLESAQMTFEDDSFLHNLSRMMNDASQEELDESELILSQREFLLEGIQMPELYEREILSAKNFKHAQELKERVIRVQTHEARQANQGFLSSLGTGFLGYMADPTSWVAIGAGAKVTGTIATNAGRAGMSRTGTGVVTGAAVAGGEEIIRTLPRLMNDPTYNMDRYQENIVLTAAFGGAFGGIFTGAQAAKQPLYQKMRPAQEWVANKAHQYGYDVQVRTVGNALASTVEGLAKRGGVIEDGLIRAVRDLDPQRVYREAREKANEQVASKLREVDTRATRESLLDDSGDFAPVNVANSVDATLTDVTAAMRTRADSPEVREAIDAMEDAMRNNPTMRELDQADGVTLQEGAATEPQNIAKTINDLDTMQSKMADHLNTMHQQGVPMEQLQKAQQLMDGVLEAAKINLDAQARRHGQAGFGPEGQARNPQSENAQSNTGFEPEAIERLQKAYEDIKSVVGAGTSLNSRVNKAILGGKGERVDGAQILSAIEEGGVKGAMQVLATNGDTALRPLYRNIANGIQQIESELGRPIRIEMAPDHPRTQGPQGTMAGWADASEMAIYLDTNAAAYANNLEELLSHEAAHLITLRNYIRSDKLSHISAARDIDNINETLKAHYRTNKGEWNPETTKGMSQEDLGRLDYALSNGKELLAMGMTNRMVQRAMESVSSVGNVTMFSRFVNAVRKSLGMEAQANTQLSKFLRATELLSEGRQAPVDAVTQLRTEVNRLQGMANAQTEISKLANRIDHELQDMLNMIDAHPGTTADEVAKIKAAMLEMQDVLDFHVERGGIEAAAKETARTAENTWKSVGESWKEGMDLATIKKVQDQYDSLAQKAISNQYGALTESMASRMFRSGDPLAQWAAMNILEMPAGTGGLIARQNTASILTEQFNMPLQHQLGKMWEDAAAAHAAATDLPAWKKLGLSKSAPQLNEHTRDLSEMIYREVNSRRLGRESHAPDYVKKFADDFASLNNQAYDMQFQNNVSGITGENKMQNYIQQKFEDGKISQMLDEGRLSPDELTDLIATSLRKAGQDDDVAIEMAKVWTAMKQQDFKRMKTEPFSIDRQKNAGDQPTRQEIMEQIRKNVKGPRREEIIEKAEKAMKTGDHGGPDYTMERTYNFDFDAAIMRADGSEVRMFDILDTDVVGQTARYMKTASGMSALSKATGGRIRGIGDIDDFITELSRSAQETGTYVNTKDVRNVMRQMVGLSYDGQMPSNMRKVRDAVALAGMNGLGESQLAELGLATNRGWSGLYALGQVTKMNARKAGNKLLGRDDVFDMSDSKTLNELSELTGLITDAHLYERRGVHYDTLDTNADTGILNSLVDTVTFAKFHPQLQYMQSRYTGYGAIRAAENQIAMAGIMQDFAKEMTGRSPYTSRARFADIGLMTADGESRFAKYFDGSDAVVQYKEVGHVQSLNLEQWSEADKQAFGVALNRHAAQQVQRGFAGEMAPELMNPWVGFLTQFKSYPLLAAEKQQGRNIKFADKELAMGVMMNSLSSALARSVRYHSMAAALPEERRESYLERKHEPSSMMLDTFTYMGIAGMFPSINEHAGQIGLPNFGDSHRFNDSGIPVVGWAQNYVDAVGGTANMISGNGDEQDLTRIANGLPLGTIAYSNMLQSVVRDVLLNEEDGEE